MPSSQPAVLELSAPVSGIVVSLDDVPDEAFRQRLVGDGLAFDPLGDTLVAPCDATVLLVHRAKHALTLDVDGLELVLHLGLDTVKLDGAGLEPLVKTGDRVKRGDPLLRFSPDLIATRALSLITPMVVANMDHVERIEAVTGRVQSGQAAVLRVFRKSAAKPDAPKHGAAVLRSQPMRVQDPTGLHARPAAALAAVARRFTADLRLAKGNKDANLRSVVSLMALEVSGGDLVTVVASGDDAAAALAAVSALLAAAPEPTAAAPVQRVAAEATPDSAITEGLLRGVTASPGTAVGVVVQLRHDDVVQAARAADANEERRQLDAAVAAAHLQLEGLRTRLTQEGQGERATIFAAHQELLEDPEMLDQAIASVREGWTAAWAWQQAYTAQAQRLAALSDPLLAARATDLRDVGRRVLHSMIGRKDQAQELPMDAVVIAEDLTPSEAAELDRTRVRALCTTMGSSTSHVAIIARGLGLPAIAGLDARALRIPAGTRVLVDADAGRLQIAPSAAEEQLATSRRAARDARRSAARAVAQQDAVTRDGQRIDVAANIGDVRQGADVLAGGADGVGLLRSEFIFQARDREPNEDEQTELYGSVARALGPERLLIIRTLDIGGDKPLPYLPMAKEENPFLGARGIRFTLAEPAVMRRQLRAILRSATEGKVAVMFPMIATLAEWRAAAAMLEEERVALKLPRIPVGIMVETAAAALMADHFAREADFLSLGTNDLTQYTLAMDRTNPRLSVQVDALHPAVLRLIATTAEAAAKHGKWAGVCGALAADPLAIPVLIGLGVSELSVDLPVVAESKARVRELSLAECRETAQLALACADGEEVRALVRARHGEVT
jgi:phosphoenolpyruvate-protein phosphotransferase